MGNNHLQIDMGVIAKEAVPLLPDNSESEER